MGATVDRRLEHTPAPHRARADTDLPSRRPPPWLRRHLAALLVVDGAAATVAVFLARYWAFGTGSATLRIGGTDLPYILATVIAVPAWLLALAVSHGYNLGPFGHIDKQSRRIVSAGAHFLAVTAVIYYTVNIERVAREFLIAIIPLAVALTLGGRAAAHLHLQRARQRGEADRRTVFLGPVHTTRPVIEHLRRQPASGISFVAPPGDQDAQGHEPSAADPATSSEDGSSPAPAPKGSNGANGSERRPVDDFVLRADTPDEVLDLLRRTDADLILVTTTLDPGELRTLTWALEGSGVTVLVAPPSTPMADPQLDVRPVAGLPLLYVERRRSTPVAI